ncbi:MAG TPA: carbohydrate ABC transporter permease, partial [Candidatus Polarisedimenticolia bacterium]|nr:carbohydrate ABC transporter permease [Candidatus Polarisedimenticolia bacterium]
LVLFFFLLRALGPRFRRRLGNGDILFWIISQRILPPVVAALPIYVMFQKLHLLDTQAALIVTYTTVNLPIVVWLMYDFFIAVPKDLEESAQLDGASRFRIFIGIVLPLAKPGLIATGLLVLILAWNEYLLALFLSTAKAQTIPLLVAAQNATRGPQWWYMSVLIIIMIAPVLVITITLQKYIAKGLLLGAVKG